MENFKMTSLSNNESFELNDSIETQLMLYKKFEVIDNGKRVILIILDHQINELYSQSLIDESAFICVYFPTSTEKITKTNGQEIITTDYQNRAYFIANLKKGPIHKQILPFDDPYLKKHYKINVMPNGNPRWNHVDFEKYHREKEPTEPKQLFELQKQTCKKYLEFDDESIYDMF